MLEDDIIEEVKEACPWVSNLVMVCCDLREVNTTVIRERYILPKVDDTLQPLFGIQGVRISIDDVITHSDYGRTYQSTPKGPRTMSCEQP